METELRVPMPTWRYRGSPTPEEASIEYKRLRLVVERKVGRTGWYATAHPLMRDAPLKAGLLAEAQSEALLLLADKATVLTLKVKVLTKTGLR